MPLWRQKHCKRRGASTEAFHAGTINAGAINQDDYFLIAKIHLEIFDKYTVVSGDDDKVIKEMYGLSKMHCPRLSFSTD
jgi:hypothetical protein